jgi:hypothetical protein
MKTGLAANLVLAALAAGLALALYLRPEKQEAGFPLSSLDPARVSRIAIERRGAEPLVLERAASGWRVVAPFPARADPFVVKHLLSILEARASHRLAATDLDRFGLAAPAARLALDDQVFAFGMLNPVAPEQYVLAGGAVYTVSPHYASALPAGVEPLLSRRLFGPEELPVSVALDDFTVAEERGRWTIAPAQGEASQDDLGHWMDRWRNALALRVERYDGRTPLAQIRVGFANGGALALGILAREPDLVLARADEHLQYHFPGEAGRRLLARPQPQH